MLVGVHEDPHHIREKLAQPEGRRMYARRASTVEPVFGIIKEVMKFRRALRIVMPRGLWTINCCRRRSQGAVERVYKLVGLLPCG
jgi:hypothetical protein